LDEIQARLDSIDKSPQDKAKIYQYSTVYGDKNYSSVLNEELLYLIGLFLLAFFLLFFK
jgi:hypothetical protein